MHSFSQLFHTGEKKRKERGEEGGGGVGGGAGEEGERKGADDKNCS